MSSLDVSNKVSSEMKSAVQEGDSIDRWLSVLVRLLHVSRGQRSAIRDEVESHLRERVRDLQLIGRDENDSIRTAIAELGEVADLARRFSRAAKSRTRRFIMNMGLIGVGAMGIATATFFVNAPQADSHGMAVMESVPPLGDISGQSALDTTVMDVSFTDQPLEDVLRFVASAAELDLVLNRRVLDGACVELSTSVTLDMVHSQSLAQVLRLVADQFEEPFDWRVSNGIMEVATRDLFDRRSIVLASFDVDAVLDLINRECNDLNAAANELECLVVDYVEPVAWYANGGDLAQVSVVGGKMFVKAPSRFHEPIKWILAQLEENAGEAFAPSGFGSTSSGLPAADSAAAGAGSTSSGGQSGFGGQVPSSGDGRR